MKKASILLLIIFTLTGFAQVRIPVNVMFEILRCEDERRFDATLEKFMRSSKPEIRSRAALAAGRIGNEKALPILIRLAERDESEEVRANAIFAIGEIESVKAAEAIRKILLDENQPQRLRALAIEAAGKIAAANTKTNSDALQELRESILDALENEARKKAQSRTLILKGITAAFRSQADDADSVVAFFLTHLDPRIRADAANAIARLKSKNYNEALRAMLLTDPDPIARANAARALGNAQDKDSASILSESAVSDDDLRVRVSAIRAIASTKDKDAAKELLIHATELLKNFKKSPFRNPVEKNELLEITTALGVSFAQSYDEKTLEFLRSFRSLNQNLEPEIESAYATVAPNEYLETIKKELRNEQNWRSINAIAKGLEKLAELQDAKPKIDAVSILRTLLNKAPVKAQPAVLSAFSAFKTKDAEDILRACLDSNDIFVRATAADLLAQFPPDEATSKALTRAFLKSMQIDTDYDDAQIAILNALAKLDKGAFLQISTKAFSSPNYLVRKLTFNLINEISEDFKRDESAFDKFVGTVRPYDSRNKTKLGQVINTKNDYLRAISRITRKPKAMVTTEKGKFTIKLTPENAPLTVNNFIKLASMGFFNGLEIHRVVPNFVIQDGDPRGDSNGGPGWQIRCEINMLEYDRGAVGMALSGKDTGGSQWFITHSPQPHLDGGYTVFGYVDEEDMKVVDSIVRGDRILKIEIIETSTKGIKRQNLK